jgi:hypothetical protein
MAEYTAGNYLVYNPAKMTDKEICEYAFQCVERWREYNKMADDAAMQNINFIYKDQWDANTKGRRTAANKPCYQNNFILPIQRKLIAEQRQAMPDIVTVPKNNDIPPKLPAIYEGIYRQISYESGADDVYSKCYDDELNAGWGALLVDTMQEEEDSVYNKLYFPYIQDILRCGWDPSSQLPNKTDGDFCFIYTIMSKKEFCRLYPELENYADAESVSINTGGYTAVDKDSIMLLSIWCREYYNVKKVILQNGTQMDRKEYNTKEKDLNIDNMQRERTHKQFIQKLIDGGAPKEYLPPFQPQRMPKIDRQQKVTKTRLHHYLLTRHHILQHSKENEAVKMLPLIYVPGETKTIDGKVRPLPFAAFAQTAQAGINYCLSEMLNALNKSFTPKIMATTAMIANRPHIANDPDIAQTFVYDLDPNFPGATPGVLSMPPIDGTYLTLYQQFINDLRSVLGRNDENLGDQSNAQSGIAISYRQFAGDLSVGPYNDNLLKGIGSLAKATFERIPYVFDTERDVSIRHKDGKGEFVKVNSAAYEVDDKGGMKLENELAKGKFDVEVKGGSSFMSQRLSVINMLSQFVRMDPQKLGVISYDLIAELFPIIDSYTLVNRIKQTITPPQIVEEEEGKRPQPPQPSLEAQALQIKGKADLIKAMADMMEAKNKMEEMKLKAVSQAEEYKIDNKKIDAQVAESYLELEKTKAESTAEVIVAAIDSKDKAAEREANIVLNGLEQENRVIDNALKSM